MRDMRCELDCIRSRMRIVAGSVDTLTENARAHVDRGQRVAQVVSEDRQERSWNSWMRAFSASAAFSAASARCVSSASRRSVRSRVTFAKPTSSPSGCAAP